MNPPRHRVSCWICIVSLAMSAGCRSKSAAPGAEASEREAAGAAPTTQPRPTPSSAEPSSAEPSSQPPAAGVSQPAGSRQPTEARRPPAIPPALLDAEAIEGRLLESAKHLASDALEGRGIRTRGIDLAADYLAEQFAEIGLKTNSFAGSPFQQFTYGARIALTADNRLQLTTASGATALQVEQDYRPTMRSVGQPLDLPLVFVGYGISSENPDYDDYAGLDVAGAAVIVLRHEPRADDPDSPFAGVKNSPHAFIDAKIKNAVAHGAAAVLLCTDGAELRRRRDESPGSPADHDRLLSFNAGKGGAEGIPILHLKRARVDRLLSDCGAESLDALELRIDESLRPASAKLAGASVQLTVGIKRSGRQLKNVIGVLEGAGPLREETIIVGAHYDHLGMGGAGSLASWTVAVHNGADDNASGTASLLEVARQLAARRPLPRRVVFIAFTAEESGLVGSERYVAAPLVPLDKTIAMLNLDMVGRYRRSLEISGVGTATEFSSLIDQLAPRRELRVSKVSDGWGPSDHATFHERGVPVLHFFTGLHADYHRPSDDYDKLNLAGMRQISLLTADLAAALAAAPQPPQRLARNEDLWGLGLDESPPQKRSRRPRTAGPVTLGVRGVATQEGHILVTQVEQRGPAAAAGLRAGDLILSLDGQDAPDLRELNRQVGERKHGDTVRLTIRRGDIELELEPQL